MREIWGQRWLLFSLASREIRNRYVGSASGLFWALLHPLVLLAIYAVVFATIFKVKFPELGRFDFTTFVALGLWPWLMFQEGVQRGAMAVQGNANLVKKVAFPSEILVYASTGATWLIHLTGYGLVLLVLSLFFTPVNPAGLPVMFLLLFTVLLFSVALALILAALQVLFRDIEQFLIPILMVWFYATPILYPTTLVPDWLQTAIHLNPVSYFVERIRELLMGGDWRIAAGDLFALLGSLLLLWLARKFFNRLAPYFEDFL